MTEQIHPAANIFPMMSETELNELVEDIKVNGLQELGTKTKDGLVIDGRNRMKACQIAGVAMHWEHYDEDIDEVAFVISKNLHRRHLKQSQRAMIAAKMATLKVGSNQHKKEGPQNYGPSCRDDAAKLMNVSARSVDNAKHVLSNGSKPLIEAVENDELTVSFASKFIKEEPNKKVQTEKVKQGKQAMKEHITPVDEIQQKPETKETYDKDFIAAFNSCKNRLNTLKQIILSLNESEKLVVSKLVN